MYCLSTRTFRGRCPKDRPSTLGDSKLVYQKFLDNVAKFRECGVKLDDVKFDVEITDEKRNEENAKWHHKKKQKEKEKKIGQIWKCKDNEHSQEIRNSNKLDVSMCIFWLQGETVNKKLHEIATMKLDLNIRRISLRPPYKNFRYLISSACSLFILISTLMALCLLVKHSVN